MTPQELALLQDAESLYAENRFPGAVLVAHAAAEVYIGHAFTTLFVRTFGPLEDGWDKALHGKSLMRPGSRTLWKLATGGDDVTKPNDVWTRYEKAVRYRNRLAHSGQVWPTPEQARESIDAVRAFIDRLETTLAPLRAEL